MLGIASDKRQNGVNVKLNNVWTQLNEKLGIANSIGGNPFT